MNVLLMDGTHDVDRDAPLPPHSEVLIQDLDLETLFDAMTNGDRYLRRLAERGLLISLATPASILYRQRVLADCLAQRDVVRAMYDIGARAIAERRRVFPSVRTSVDSVRSQAVRALEVFAAALDDLHRLVREHAGAFESEGFVRLFAMLQEQLDDDYRATVHHYLEELEYPRGMLINARLGGRGTTVDLSLHRPPEGRWFDWLLSSDFGREGFTFEISPRDNSGVAAIGELRARAGNDVANAAAQAADHIGAFFNAFCAEVGFYLACTNLHARLSQLGAPVCFPEPLAPDAAALSAQGLYDPCLALHLNGRPVGNDIDVRSRPLVMVTGANQGGKSTFLRSLGVAQLMMQAGMFVAAESFRASPAGGLFTHFKREEDLALESGKLDEELQRMSAIVAAIGPGAVLLCNESFASTNEQEGSEIARQVISALIDTGVRVVFVTHLFTLAHGFCVESPRATLFLRAERLADGRRSFRLIEGEPQPTSYGEDAYRKVFGDGTADALPSPSSSLPPS